MLALGLGANLGDAEATLRRALAELRRRLGPLQVAPLYRSTPISPIWQPDFFNTVALAERPATAGAARQLLREVKALELAAGRDLAAERHGPRPLDIDLLFWGDLCLDDPALVLPHPELRHRRFVLAPLADLAPDLPLPGDRTPAAAALAALGDGQHVERIEWTEDPPDLS